jgi:serine/threonine-protein kinase RsbW
MDRLSLSLILPSDLRMLCVARAFMESACHAARLDADHADSIVLALHEAVSNIVRHAHHDLPEARLEIHCCVSPDLVEIQVLDEGPLFDLNTVPDLDPAELRIGGRGVFLMRALMDELSCQPRGERGNILRMVKYRSRHSRMSECG